MRRFASATSAFVTVVAGLTLLPPAPALAARPRHVADVTSRPDAVSAQLAARTTGHRVMDLSQSTVYGNVYANPNGTWTSTNATGPVQVKDSHGTWHGIDSALAVGKDGRLREKWALDDASFSAGGDSTVATMTSQGVSTTWSWPGRLPKPTVAGNVATYKINADENLVVTASGTGFTEDVVLTRRPTAARTLVLPLAAKGGAFSRTSTGLQMSNRKGKVGLFIPTPYAFDSSKNAGGEPAVGAIETSVAGDGSLAMKPDWAFLSNPKTVYPVTIDPSFTIYNSSDTWLQYPDYTTSQSSSTEDKVGTYDGGGHIARTFLAFPQTNFVGRHILSANLVLNNWYSGSCTAGNVYAWQITQSWSATGITWGAQPSISSSNNVAYSPAHGYSSSCPAGNATWNILGMAQAWSNGAARDGIELRAGSETSNYTWRRYRSSNYATTSQRPYITATYNSYPGTPTAPNVSPVSSYTPPGGSATNYTSSSTPTVSSTVSDADGGSVRATFSFYTSKTGSAVASCTSGYVASGTAASCRPSTSLSNTTYYVKSQAYDGTDYSKASSSWSTIVVAAGTPAAPVITCPGYANGSWSDTPPTSNVSCTISATGSGTTAPGKISYAIDGATTQSVVTIKQSTDPTVADATVSVSNSSGAHAITATAISPAGTASSSSTLSFGYGSLSLNAPAASPLLRTTGTVAIDASGPPATNGTTPTAVLKWRQSGSGNDATTGWTTSAIHLNVGAGSGGGIEVTGTWNSSSDLAAAGIDTRVPQLLDLEVCVAYSSSTTQCSWPSDATQVLHLAHAFGSGFPTTSVPGGQVALWTGELESDATDASLNAGASALSVGRTASTFGGPAADAAANVFGPGWTAHLTGDASAGHADAQVIDATVEQGVLIVVDSSGETLVYKPTAGLAQRTSTYLATGTWVPVDSITSQSGIAASVTSGSGGTSVTLTDPDGTTTTFNASTAPTSTKDAVFAPGAVKEPGSASSTTYAYDGSGRVTRILAPVPAGVSCSISMNTGCRGLDIAYASATTATSGTPGDFAGQVKTIATDIGGTTTVVVSYAYDTSGRLVSVTDPRTGLATTYGYDGTSTRIASITNPGQTPVNYVYNSSQQLTQVTRVRPSDAPSGTADLATIVYGIPTSGSAATSAGLPDLSASAVSAWAQPSAPTYGAAVFGPDHPLSASTTASSLTSSDGPYASTYYTNAEGYTLNTGTYGAGQWLLTDTEYDALGSPVRELSAGDIAAIEAGTLAPVDAGQLTVYNTQQTDSGGNVILPADSETTDSYETARQVTLADGTQAWLRPHTHTTYDEGAPNSDINPATGQKYALATTVTSGAANPSSVLTAAGSSEPADVQVNSIVHTGYNNAVPGGSDPNAGWNQGLASTTSTVMDNSVAGGTSGAAAITNTTTYNALGQTVATRKPMSNGSDPGTRNSVYYQAGTGSGVGVCDNHPELQGVLCQTNFAGNPASGPAMITTTYGYNSLQQPTTLTETSGATTRTTTTTYDTAGRTTGTSIVVTGLAGSTSVPATTVGYDPATGLPTTTAPAGGANGGTITTAYDAWGRVHSYTNSTGTSTTTYDAAGNQASTTAADGTVTTYAYDGTDANGHGEHRGLVTSQTAAGHGVSTTMTAAYDANGNAINQTYGSGISLTNTYDTGGDLTQRVYSGDITDPSTSVVTPNSPWIGWTQAIDAAGRVAADWTPDGGATTGDTTGAAATGFSDSYTYDPADRLTQVVDQTVPAGVGGVATDGTVTGGACTIRTYGFDANGNRTTKSVIPASADGGCQSPSNATGAVTSTWSHDSADRITNSGYVYDNLGRITTIPQADSPLAQAGGTPGNLTLTYFDTDQIQAQTQNGTTVSNTLDAAGRPLTQTTGPTGGSVTSTTTMGYTDDSDSPGFETTTSGGATTSESYVDGPDGLLGATLTSAGTVQIAVSDPRGGVVSQITLPSAGDAAGLDTWSNNDEYGNPVNASTTGSTATNPVGDATGGLGYGWEGAHKRDTDPTGLIQMGARLYDPATGTFTSNDPVYGGNSTAYTYPEDPINGSDLTGSFYEGGYPGCSWYCGHYHLRPNPRVAARSWNSLWGFGRRHWRGIAVAGVMTGCMFMTAGACAVAATASSVFIHGWNYTHHEESLGSAVLGSATDAGFAAAGYGLTRFGERYIAEFGHSYRRWRYLNSFHAGLPGMFYSGFESWHHWH